LGVALALAAPVIALAQDVAGPNLMAEVVVRFAMPATWPPDVLPDGEPLRICVAGDRAVRDALERAVSGTTIQNRPVVVLFSGADRPPANCNVLYISSVSPAQARRLVAAVKDAPVLTMSDLERFNEGGGIVEFFYDAGRLRFSLRLDAMKQSRIQLPARLIQLSRPRR
jgi:hypothetical protein